MFYPIWQPLPRPRHSPEDPKLDRLLDGNFDPRVGYFKLRLWRREARDLRKGLFGPKGIRKDTPKGAGVRTFDLPNDWTLRLTYDAPPDDRSEPGNVVAEFIPPTTRKGPSNSLQRPTPLVEGALALAAAPPKNHVPPLWPSPAPFRNRSDLRSLREDAHPNREYAGEPSFHCRPPRLDRPRDHRGPRAAVGDHAAPPRYRTTQAGARREGCSESQTQWPQGQIRGVAST
jgi:hypothetical protein